MNHMSTAKNIAASIFWFVIFMLSGYLGAYINNFNSINSNFIYISHIMTIFLIGLSFVSLIVSFLFIYEAVYENLINIKSYLKDKIRRIH